MKDEKVSKFLSYVLRHKPDAIGLQLDANGWVDVEELLDNMAYADMAISIETLQRIVRESDKQRFAFSEDGARIRANQGHSINVDLALPDREPPAELFHGTATRFLESIRKDGLIPRSRHAVHLSANYETALNVGQRHGSPVVLRIASGKMFSAGFRFQCSENGVWLTEKVPAEFISV